MKQKFNPAQTFDLGWVKVAVIDGISVTPYPNKISIGDHVSFFKVVSTLFIEKNKDVDIEPGTIDNSFFIKDASKTLAQIIFPEENTVPKAYSNSANLTYGTLYWKPSCIQVNADSRSDKIMFTFTYEDKELNNRFFIYKDGNIDYFSKTADERFCVKALSDKLIAFTIFVPDNSEHRFEAILKLN